MSGASFVVALVLLAPAAAGAQGLAGPFGGLFGRTPERAGQEFTTVEFRSAAGGQYDDAVLLDVTPAGLATSGHAAGVNAALKYERRGDRLRARLQGVATRQQFFRAPASGANSYEAEGLLVAPMATRLSLETSGGYRRSPNFHLLPSAGAWPSPDLAVPSDALAIRRLDHESVEGTVGVTSAYAKRSTISAAVSRRATRFAHQPWDNFAAWGARGSWRRNLTEDVAAHVGYSRESIQQAATGDGQFVHEVVDIGVDLLREVSLARRTALTFNTQTSMVRESGGDRRYRLNGGLAVTRGFRRTWVASVAANRTTEFLPGFLQPVFADSLSGSLSGLLTKRIEWSATLGAGRGQVGFDGGDPFLTYTGTTRLSTGVTRHLGLYAEYAYYLYEMPPGASSVVLLPGRSRRSVSVGLAAFVPIFTRERAGRDPR